MTNPNKPGQDSGASNRGNQNSSNRDNSQQNAGQFQGAKPGAQPGATYQSGQYPKWDQTWNRSLPEVDRQIEEYYGSSSREIGPEGNRELGGKIRKWFQEQTLDNDTRSQFDEVSNGDAFQWQIDQRASNLNDEGRIHKSKSGTGSAG